MDKLTRVLVTGASGFIGRSVIDALKEDHIIYAVARRSRKEAGIPYHKNIRWVQCDLSNPDTVQDMLNYLREDEPVTFIIHLAAFYDFTYEDHPEYLRTNINGTKNILEVAKELEVKRFIFSSSLAACKFPENGDKVTETTPADAEFAYAKSKKEGEILVESYSRYLPGTVLRFAAVFSDWCEYAPLYKFLLTWLGRRPDSRFIAGRGESGIPYIHISDVVSIIKTVLKNSASLDSYCVFNASPDGCVSHRELYEIATSYHFGDKMRPLFVPKPIIYPGMLIKKLLAAMKLWNVDSFEKFWMVKYIDKRLEVSSELTRRTLNWAPVPRNHITRKLLFLIEKSKSHPAEWHIKNEAALTRVGKRTNLMIYETLSKNKESVILQITDTIMSRYNDPLFQRYAKMNDEDFRCYVSTLYHLLMATVRSGDRSLMIQYIDQIAIRRYAEGFLPEEIRETLNVIKEITLNRISNEPELKGLKQTVYDYIGLTLQLAQDEVEEQYERLISQIPRDRISDSSLLPDCKKLQQMIRQLSAFTRYRRKRGSTMRI